MRTQLITKPHFSGKIINIPFFFCPIDAATISRQPHPSPGVAVCHLFDGAPHGDVDALPPRRALRAMPRSADGKVRRGGGVGGVGAVMGRWLNG